MNKFRIGASLCGFSIAAILGAAALSPSAAQVEVPSKHHAAHEAVESQPYDKAEPDQIAQLRAQIEQLQAALNERRTSERPLRDPYRERQTGCVGSTPMLHGMGW